MDELYIRIEELEHSDWFSTFLNSVVGGFQDALKDVNNVMGNVAQGDLTTNITTEYSGDYLVLKDSVNNTIHKLATVVSEVNSVSSHISSGMNEISKTANDISNV